VKQSADPERSFWDPPFFFAHRQAAGSPRDPHLT